MYIKLKMKWLAYDKSIATAQRATCSRVIKEAKEDLNQIVYITNGIVGIKDQSNEEYMRWRNLAKQIKRVERNAIDVLMCSQTSIW